MSTFPFLQASDNSVAADILLLFLPSTLVSKTGCHQELEIIDTAWTTVILVYNYQIMK